RHPTRDGGEAAREVESGAGLFDRPVVGEILRLSLNALPSDPVERLEEEEVFDREREVRPERIAPREMTELMREQRFQLFFRQFEGARGDADFGESDRDRAGDGGGFRQTDLLADSGAAAQSGESEMNGAVGQLSPITGSPPEREMRAQDARHAEKSEQDRHRSERGQQLRPHRD